MSKSRERIQQLLEAGLRVFRPSQAQVVWKRDSVHLILSRLCRDEWIERLIPGVYAINASLLGGSPIHEFEIAMVLTEPAAIGFWSAMRYHNFTDQIPRDVFVLTTARVRRAEIRVREVRYRIVRVPPQRYFGVEQRWVGDAQINVTDQERTLIDGLSRSELCGGFSEVMYNFEQALTHVNHKKLVDYALRYGRGVPQRLGWVLEMRGIDTPLLKDLEAQRSTGYLRLDPRGPSVGAYNARWRIQENIG